MAIRKVSIKIGLLVGSSLALLSVVLIGLSLFFITTGSTQVGLVFAQKKLQGDLAFMKELFSQRYGSIDASGNELVDKQGQGLTNLQGFLEGISSMSGDLSTVFLRQGNDFVRIATTVVNQEGKRAVGTTLGVDNPVTLSLIKNQGFQGSAQIIGKNHKTGYEPITNEANEVIGALFVGTPLSDLEETIGSQVASSMIILGLVGAGVFLFAVGGSLIIAVKGISAPIRQVATALEEISKGEGDLSAKVGVKSSDETGQLAESFNQTLGKINRLIIVIREAVEHLVRVGDDLASSMTESAASVNQISSNIDSIHKQIDNQGMSTNQTTTAIATMSQNISELDSILDEQSSVIKNSSLSIRSMIDSFNEVSLALGENTLGLGKLVEASQGGRDEIEAVSQMVNSISQRSQELLEISNVVQNIASQTNLLAMNAAIEAAHAGQSGKGFAVVADEIRKLAESSGAQSQTISKSLKDIRSAIEKITQATSVIIHRFDDINQQISRISKQEHAIKASMDMQVQRSEGIVSSIGTLEGITKAVASLSNQIQGGSSLVLKESKSLQRISAEVQSSMAEMTTGVHEINLAMHTIVTISDTNREVIQRVRQELGKFKTAS